MQTFVVLLRGINVGGHNKIKMAEFRDILEKSGFKNVSTYIQSGNIVLESDLDSAEKIDTKVKDIIRESYGYVVSVLSIKSYDFREAYRQMPWSVDEVPESKFLSITFCRGEFDTTGIPCLKDRLHASELFEVKSTNLYLYCPQGYSKTKITNGDIEKFLKVRATTRNWNTVGKLVSMIGGPSATLGNL